MGRVTLNVAGYQLLRSRVEGHGHRGMESHVHWELVMLSENLDPPFPEVVDREDRDHVHLVVGEA